MTRNERACQIWSILALAARSRQVLTYDPNDFLRELGPSVPGP